MACVLLVGLVVFVVVILVSTVVILSSAIGMVGGKKKLTDGYILPKVW